MFMSSRGALDKTCIYGEPEQFDANGYANNSKYIRFGLWRWPSGFMMVFNNRVLLEAIVWGNVSTLLGHN